MPCGSVPSILPDVSGNCRGRKSLDQHTGIRARGRRRSRHRSIFRCARQSAAGKSECAESPISRSPCRRSRRPCRPDPASGGSCRPRLTIAAAKNQVRRARPKDTLYPVELRVRLLDSPPEYRGFPHISGGFSPRSLPAFGSLKSAEIRPFPHNLAKRMARFPRPVSARFGAVIAKSILLRTACVSVPYTPHRIFSSTPPAS